jgi:site-specific DNA recombinase
MQNQQQTRINQGEVVLYIRTNQSGSEGSTEDQLDELRNFCLHEGKTIVATYVDEGFSGAPIDNLPSLNRLLEGAKAGDFDEVLTVKLNRLCRNSSDLLTILQLLKKQKVAFRSLENPKMDTSSDEGEFFMHILAAVQELEENIDKEAIERGN